MTTTESSPVCYHIEAPGIDYYSSGMIIPNTRNVMKLSGNLTEKLHIFPTSKGIFLNTSSDKVTVIGQHITDTFQVLPITILNTHEYVYYPFSVAPLIITDALVAIVGTSDDTTMILKAAVDSKISFNSSLGWIILGAGEEQTYIINRLQTVYMSANLIDSTGSKIVADKPLSVISSHKCVFVQSQAKDCNRLISQVLPTAIWDKTYYVAPLPNRKSYTLKIIAAYDETQVQLICNGIQRNFLIDDGESFKQVYRNQECCAVHSIKKISVVQLSYGASEDDVGDPIMTLVPTVNDYSNKIAVSTNDYVTDTGYKQYICNIIVISAYYQPELIYLNMGGINQTLESYNWIPIVVNNITEAYTTQVYLDVTDSEEIFQISHVYDSALMSAIIYGFIVNLTPQRVHSRAVTNPSGGFNIFDLSRSKFAKFKL